MAAPIPPNDHNLDGIDADAEDQEEIFIEEGEDYEELIIDGDVPMDEDAEGGEDQDPEAVQTDNSIQHFPGHSKSVFCVSAHPTQPIAASGGEDDLGYIWDTTKGEEILKLEGHSDSVTSIEFSSDGELVASGGMDGKVRIWKHTGETWRTWEFLMELEGPDEVMWIKWHPKGTVLLAGSQDGTVWLWQLPSGNIMQVFAGHKGPVSVGQFTPDGKRIITASEDGSLIFWDPREAGPVFKLSSSDGRFSLDGGITSLSVNPASTVAVVGGADGGLRVVNLRKGEVVGALDGHNAGESVEAITFLEWAGGPQSGTGGGGVVATGGTDGKICIWDLGTMKLRATLEHADSITSLHPHPAPMSHLFTSSSADGTLKTWDAKTAQIQHDHTGHAGPVLGAALGFGEGGIRVVVSAGDDSACLVFATD